MSAKVLVIGLDAADAPTLEAAASRGEMPTLAALRAAGAAAPLANCVETLQGAVWPELNSGRSCHHHARFYHTRQVHTGEAALRPLTPEEMGPDESYWAVAGRAGRRVAAVDVTHAVKVPGLNGIQLIEWGLHDRTFDIESEPRSLLTDIRRAHGDHPVGNCDHYPTTDAGYRRLHRDLIEGVKRKTDVLLDIVGREDWDLFTLNFSEGHCAGHHFWHLHDPDSPWHRPDAPDDLKDMLLDVYRAIDAAAGEVVAAAGPDASVVMVTSHGMGPYTGGYQLVPEVLSRLGLGSDEGRAVDSPVRRANNALKYVVPMAALPWVYRLAGATPVRRIQDRQGCLVDPLQSPRTRAAAVPNNRTGAIRLNLEGREPYGRVVSGPEADALGVEIADAFRSLVLPGTDTPIVEWVKPIDEVYGDDRHPDLPDLLVRFRHDLGVIEECWSRRLGHVRVPLNRAYNPRTGDHTPVSRLWLRAPGIGAGAELPEANALDLAPTVLRLLDVPVPNWMDGRPLAAVG